MEGLEKHSQETQEKGKPKFDFKVEFGVFVWRPYTASVCKQNTSMKQKVSEETSFTPDLIYSDIPESGQRWAVTNYTFSAALMCKLTLTTDDRLQGTHAEQLKRTTGVCWVLGVFFHFLAIRCADVLPQKKSLSKCSRP